MDILHTSKSIALQVHHLIMNRPRTSPRKFSEKIALLNKKESEANAAFASIIKEVEETTRAACISSNYCANGPFRTRRSRSSINASDVRVVRSLAEPNVAHKPFSSYTRARNLIPQHSTCSKHRQVVSIDKSITANAQLVSEQTTPIISVPNIEISPISDDCLQHVPLTSAPINPTTSVLSHNCVQDTPALNGCNAAVGPLSPARSLPNIANLNPATDCSNPASRSSEAWTSENHLSFFGTQQFIPTNSTEQYPAEDNFFDNPTSSYSYTTDVGEPQSSYSSVQSLGENNGQTISCSWSHEDPSNSLPWQLSNSDNTNTNAYQSYWPYPNQEQVDHLFSKPSVIQPNSQSKLQQPAQPIARTYSSNALLCGAGGAQQDLLDKEENLGVPKTNNQLLRSASNDFNKPYLSESYNSNNNSSNYCDSIYSGICEDQHHLAPAYPKMRSNSYGYIGEFTLQDNGQYNKYTAQHNQPSISNSSSYDYNHNYGCSHSYYPSSTDTQINYSEVDRVNNVVEQQDNSTRPNNTFLF